MNKLTKTVKLLRQCNAKFVRPITLYPANQWPRGFLTYSIARHKECIEPSGNYAEKPMMEFKGHWPGEELQHFKNDMRVLVEFINETEETKLFDEIESYMKRLRYEYDHWDDAIHGFRETERKHWYPHNRDVLERVRHVGFDGEIMPYIHILDLAPQGVIKPHVDSARYCGPTIAGLSLLSDSVMRLVRTVEDDHRQTPDKNNDSGDVYRSQPKGTIENNFYVDILLPRRSLYIMRMIFHEGGMGRRDPRGVKFWESHFYINPQHYESKSARYNFTHEILVNEDSKFLGQPIIKSRRISIICRNEP